MKTILLLLAAGLCLLTTVACSSTPHGSSGIDGGRTLPELSPGGRLRPEHTKGGR